MDSISVTSTKGMSQMVHDQLMDPNHLILYGKKDCSRVTNGDQTFFFEASLQGVVLRVYFTAIEYENELIVRITLKLTKNMYSLLKCALKGDTLLWLESVIFFVIK